MFDTVTLKTGNVLIEPKKFESIDPHSLRKRINIDAETGEIVESYQVLNDEQLPYIRYFESSRTLKIQVSIPKFLYGENITLVDQRGVEKFFEQLHEKLSSMFGVQIEPDRWITERVDICWNFNVDSVSDYITKLGKLKMPYKNTVVYNQNETVVFKNKSSQVKFYDKEKESEGAKARGIVRMEIQPAMNDLRKFSPNRKAIELLTREFFVEQTKAALEKLNPISDIETDLLSLDWLSSDQIHRIEKVVAFSTIQQLLGDVTTRRLYGHNYYNRKKLLAEIGTPFANCRYELNINYDDVG